MEIIEAVSQDYREVMSIRWGTSLTLDLVAIGGQLLKTTKIMSHTDT